MAITLNPTPAQTARVQAAVDDFNATYGHSLTLKAWVYMVLREAVVTQLAAKKNREAAASHAAAEQAANSEIAAALADMEGGA